MMRIGTYNILKFQGYPEDVAAKVLGDADSPERVEHFARVFNELDCDILALQEGGASQMFMQRLAQRIDMHLATSPSPGKWPGQILSRYPILESRTFSHYRHDESVPPLSRCAGAALLEIDSERRMWVFNIHLHPHDRELRDKEAAIIDERVRELSAIEEDVVVLGDFNCLIDESVHHLLKEQGFVNVMEEVGGGLGATRDTAGVRSLRSIDHIYVSSGLADKLSSAHVVRAPGFRHDESRPEGVWDHSDHLPVVAELVD